jgi:hypothetical protein
MSFNACRIVNELQKVQDWDAVIVNNNIAGSALLAHPRSECNEERRILCHRLDSTRDVNAGTTKVSHEQAHTAQQDMPGLSRMTETRALAFIQVIVEARNDLPVDTPEGNAFYISPVNEVFCGTDMPSGRDLRIPGGAQLLCEIFEQRSVRAGAKCLNSERGIEELIEHDVLL